MRERGAQEGVIVKDTRLEAWRAIREHQMSADHPYRDVARRWYPIVDDMEATFFNGIVYPDGQKVPAPLLAFEEYNKKSLAHVDLFSDEYGLIGKITVNTAYFVDFGEKAGKTEKKYVLGDYSLGETIIHEFAHVWQQFGPRAKDPFDQKKHHRVTHNAEWHNLVRSFGLNTEGPAGLHTKPATPGSPVDLFLRRHGITPPEGTENLPYDEKKNWSIILTYKDKKPKGRSSLTKYTCPGCGLHARIGIKDDPRLIHEPCGTLLIRDESGTIYKAGK
jgi:hypothetical protein